MNAFLLENFLIISAAVFFGGGQPPLLAKMRVAHKGGSSRVMLYTTLSALSYSSKVYVA
jgi:hypothetical protein